MKVSERIRQVVVEDRKKWSIFLICLLISSAFWTLSKLSGNYETSSEFKFHFEFEDEDQIIVKGGVQNVHLDFEASGYDLLGLNTGEQRLVQFPLSAETLRRKRGNRYYLLSSDLPVQRYMDHKGFQSVSPDTLFFTLEEKTEKEVPIHFVSDISFRKEYGPVGEASINPATIQISGPRSRMEEINFVETESKVIKDLHTDIKLNLRLNETQLVGLNASTEEVEVSYAVDRYTEGKMNYDLEEFSEGKVLFPSHVDVFYQVAISNYSMVSPADILLDIEWDTLSQTAILSILRQSDFVRSVRIVPERLEYVILKE